MAARRGAQSEEALAEKRRLLAQLEADASSDSAPEGEDEDDEESGGPGGAYKAEVQRARDEAAKRAEERRLAVSRAVEREDRKRVEQETRRAVREQAGHTNSKAPGAKGAGKGRASERKGG